MTVRFGIVVSVLLACGSSACASGRVAADAFVRALYQQYGKPDRPDELGEPAPRIFAPRLLALIRADEKAAGGEVERLDEDPLCNCQDDDGFRLSSITIVRRPAGRVVATVRFRFHVVSEMVSLDLVAARGGWRVADVHSRDIPSLVSFLEGAAASR